MRATDIININFAFKRPANGEYCYFFHIFASLLQKQFEL